MNIFNSKQDIRKERDEEMYSDAFDDLLSILGISGPKMVYEAKGAIASILKFLGKKVPEIQEDITDINTQLEYLLRPSNTMKRRIELLGNWWKDGMGCLLASKKSGEIVAIFPKKFRGYEYKNNNGKMIKIDKNNASEFNIDAFCFYKSFPLDSLKIKDLLIFMVNCISKIDIVFIIGIYTLMQLLGMITPYLTKIIYDILIPSGVYNLIVPIAGTLLGLTLGTSLIRITQNVIKTRIQGKLSLSVNSAIMMRLFSLPATFFKKYSSGELASRVGYVATLCQIISDTVLSTILTAFFSLAYIFQMGQQAPTMIMPGIFLLMISIVFSIFITFARQNLNEKRINLSPKLQSLVYSFFGGIQKIKITGAEKRVFAKWAKNYSEIESLNYSPPMFLKISGVINTAIAAFGSIMLYWIATKSKVSIANYMAFNISYAAVSGAVMSLSDAALQIAGLRPILKLIEPFMKAKPENSSEGQIVTSLSGDIEINNVTFRYNEESEYILKNLSLKIKKGDYIAIVGKTGCGKSTLLRLLLGFEKPEKGAIYYNSRDINSLDMGSLRQKIGVVMQNGSIFSGDIFSNIIVTSPWKTMEDAQKAAQMTGLAEDIKKMPMGMHTLIVEGTGGISVGQKQRLMIARSIISNPPILYLDEATSALDNVTQSHVAENLAKLKCTRVVIAHRLSTVKSCNQIIVLDKGSIVEKGNFEELMAKKGKFYDLAIRQIA
ncbi:MAG: ATP-binding cassette domain-containing protein [Oscillospiraceae bacterium]|nr:ATP-binding cassette domain-containing protein [Oscillospiraceae bacterium]